MRSLDEDVMKAGCAFLPALVAGSRTRKAEALAAGASAEWLDPANTHARMFQALEETMSQAQRSRAQERSAQESGDDDDDVEAGMVASGMYMPPDTRRPKRFGVGTKVRCKVGPTEWKAGTVVAHDYREESFPPGFIAAYQVKLVDGLLIFAPADMDDCIRAA